MPHDMFDKKFKISEMKATGEIKYPKSKVDVLSACIIQADATGKITGAAYGVATGNQVDITGPVRQKKFTLPMRFMPDTDDGESRRLTAGVAATGMALYRREGANVEVWVTPDISIEH
jgi:hypothetical protein